MQFRQDCSCDSALHGVYVSLCHSMFEERQLHRSQTELLNDQNEHADSHPNSLILLVPQCHQLCVAATATNLRAASSLEEDWDHQHP